MQNQQVTGASACIRGGLLSSARNRHFFAALVQQERIYH